MATPANVNWQRKWRKFVRSGTDVRASFERAEYYALHCQDFRPVLDEHPQEKLKLWALREQLYQGDCPYAAPSMLEEYRFPQYCEKRQAWADVQGMSPGLAASKFEKLVRELAPRYMFWPLFPHGPTIQFQMAVNIQAAARRFLARKSKVKAQHKKVRQIRQLHMLGRSLVKKSEPHFTGMGVFAGFAVPSELFVHTLEKNSGLLLASKKLCAQRGFGGFCVVDHTAYFCKAVPYTLQRVKFRNDMYTLYVLCDSEAQKQAKVREAIERLTNGLSVTKHNLQSASTPATLYLEPERARLSFTRPGQKRKSAGLFMSDVAEIRIGPRSHVFHSNDKPAAPNACLTLVGSEACIDMEFPTEDTRDFWAERFGLLRQRFQMLAARQDAFDAQMISQSGWRKPFTVTELLCMNSLKEELQVGIEVIKFASNGSWESRFLWLDYLKDITIDQSGRRPRLVLTRERRRQSSAEDFSKGIDIADISAIRPGIAANNFDEAKSRMDLREIEHACLSIIASERTLCLRCVDALGVDGAGGMTGEQARDQMVKGLSVLVYGCPRVLGTLEKSDEAVAQVLQGQPHNLSERYTHMLVPRSDRKFEEKAVLDASNQASFKMAGNLAEDFDAPLSDSEARRMEAAFSMFDKDGSGEIDANELLSAMQTLGKRLDLIDAKRLIDEYDFDGNGVMDLPEFLQMMRRENAVEKAVGAMENVFFEGAEPGTDEVAEVTEAHFRHVMSMFPNAKTGKVNGVDTNPLNNAEMDSLVNLVDLSHDGKIKPQDFLVLLHASFIE